MADTAVAAPAAAPATPIPKKVAAAKKPSGPKKPAVKPAHPPTADMVNAAIAALKEKKGSSLQAIKKYIAATYKVDVEKQSTFIKKYIKSAVTKKTIVQTKGSGASGRFKLAAKPEGEKKKVVKKPAPKKATATVGQKKVPAKKPTATKKSTAAAPAVKKPKVKKPATAGAAVAPKPKVAKATKSPKTPKSPSKTKKSGKAPAAKPKAPKPKKTTTAATAAAPKPKSAKK